MRGIRAFSSAEDYETPAGGEDEIPRTATDKPKSSHLLGAFRFFILSQGIERVEVS